MTQSLHLGPSPGAQGSSIRRLNKLPLVLAVALSLVFAAVVVIGLSLRGSPMERSAAIDDASEAPATSFGDRLKRGVSDGIIAEPDDRQPLPALPAGVIEPPAVPQPEPQVVESPAPRRTSLEEEDEWLKRLQREQDEQYIRERHRQDMARLQARSVALDSPLKVDVSPLSERVQQARVPADEDQGSSATSPHALYAGAIEAGLTETAADPNRQRDKQAFFNSDLVEAGYLDRQVTSPVSRYELKRGSVVPATLVTGLNSDLPGRLIAQVSQNVYDSATGRYLLIPQGAKLFGRYDSSVSFGQQRVLVIWTDLILPNGVSLQIGGMAGTDSAGNSGFYDKVDRHYLRTFGSAALVALIGTGIDLSLPESFSRANQDTASDAARRNFAESFGRVATQTISKTSTSNPRSAFVQAIVLTSWSTRTSFSRPRILRDENAAIALRELLVGPLHGSRRSLWNARLRLQRPARRMAEGLNDAGE
ncbi:type IV secretion system protein VirB10 [Pseudorhizobium tarimense]|uniref:Type IV secretion system protein VirB10 n=1 Tax=Pseudorhizobium tarimense TaxID=1079109 RepID=A0ABV2HC04_9HYPH